MLKDHSPHVPISPELLVHPPASTKLFRQQSRILRLLKQSFFTAFGATTQPDPRTCSAKNEKETRSDGASQPCGLSSAPSSIFAFMHHLLVPTL